MVAESGVDFLITLGKRAKIIFEQILQHYVALKNRPKIFQTNSHAEALKILKEEIKPRKGDIILVKGSRGARMEKIVEKLLKDPSRASELLVCQDVRWKG